MPQTRYRDRRAFTIENDGVRVTVLQEGGHIAEIVDKSTGVNPLWTPPWPSIEPSTYDRARHSEYGTDAESKLLAGIMGHNLCMDVFGPVSDEEAAAGLTVHGEAPVASYEISGNEARMTMRARLPHAQLAFERSIHLNGNVLQIDESVENLSAADRPIAWTQHVTLGPPFLEKGRTKFRSPVTQSQPLDPEFNTDFETYTNAPSSGGYIGYLMDQDREHAFFTAWSPARRVAFGYLWRTADFRWLGLWEENYSRIQPPWNGKTLTRGMEFGVSPMPETRRRMIERGNLFGVPSFRWIGARAIVRVRYWAAIDRRRELPAALAISADGVAFA
jgi:hypothetical protein